MSDKNIHPLFTSSEKFESDLNHFAKIQYDAGFAEGFAAGRREQARVDREAVSKKLDKLAEQMEYGCLLKDGEIYRNELIQKYDQKTLTVAESVILAALAAVAPEV